MKDRFAVTKGPLEIVDICLIDAVSLSSLKQSNDNDHDDEDGNNNASSSSSSSHSNENNSNSVSHEGKNRQTLKKKKSPVFRGGDTVQGFLVLHNHSEDAACLIEAYVKLQGLAKVKFFETQTQFLTGNYTANNSQYTYRNRALLQNSKCQILDTENGDVERDGGNQDNKEEVESKSDEEQEIIRKDSEDHAREDATKRKTIDSQAQVQKVAPSQTTKQEEKIDPAKRDVLLRKSLSNKKIHNKTILSVPPGKSEWPFCLRLRPGVPGSLEIFLKHNIKSGESADNYARMDYWLQAHVTLLDVIVLSNIGKDDSSYQDGKSSEQQTKHNQDKSSISQYTRQPFSKHNSKEKKDSQLVSIRFPFLSVPTAQEMVLRKPIRVLFDSPMPATDNLLRSVVVRLDRQELWVTRCCGLFIVRGGRGQGIRDETQSRLDLACLVAWRRKRIVKRQQKESSREEEPAFEKNQELKLNQEKKMNTLAPSILKKKRKPSSTLGASLGHVSMALHLDQGAYAPGQAINCSGSWAQNDTTEIQWLFMGLRIHTLMRGKNPNPAVGACETAKTRDYCFFHQKIQPGEKKLFSTNTAWSIPSYMPPSFDGRFFMEHDNEEYFSGNGNNGDDISNGSGIENRNVAIMKWSYEFFMWIGDPAAASKQQGDDKQKDATPESIAILTTPILVCCQRPSIKLCYTPKLRQHRSIRFIVNTQSNTDNQRQKRGGRKLSPTQGNSSPKQERQHPKRFRHQNARKELLSRDEFTIHSGKTFHIEDPDQDIWSVFDQAQTLKPHHLASGASRCNENCQSPKNSLTTSMMDDDQEDSVVGESDKDGTDSVITIQEASTYPLDDCGANDVYAKSNHWLTSPTDGLFGVKSQGTEANEDQYFNEGSDIREDNKKIMGKRVTFSGDPDIMSPLLDKCETSQYSCVEEKGRQVNCVVQKK